MEKNLAKTYNPKDFEDRIYQMWEENGAQKWTEARNRLPL